MCTPLYIAMGYREYLAPWITRTTGKSGGGLKRIVESLQSGIPQPSYAQIISPVFDLFTVGQVEPPSLDSVSHLCLVLFRA